SATALRGKSWALWEFMVRFGVSTEDRIVFSVKSQSVPFMFQRLPPESHALWQKNLVSGGLVG
ncbi:MAG: hypothetical protein AAF761_03935, partial [Pseudomonadota bacterium]